MSKRTLFLIFALFLITFVLLMMALYQPSKTSTPTAQPITISKESKNQSSLSFGTPIVTLSSASSITYSLPVNITTGTNKITAVQLELQYDPLVLTKVSLAPGSFFNNPVALLSEIDTKTGRISYALGISPADNGIAGQGTAATLTFTVPQGKPQQTNILFLPKTLVTAEGLTESVLKQTTDSVLTVGENNATPSAPPVSPSAQ